jgi:hypothetical protein
MIKQTYDALVNAEKMKQTWLEKIGFMAKANLFSSFFIISFLALLTAIPTIDINHRRSNRILMRINFISMHL